MKCWMQWAFALMLGVVPCMAQTLGDQSLQIHGYATQAFALSSANNYIGLNTSSFSSGWSEAALNVQDQVTDKLRVGLQMHYTRLGYFGGEVPSIDWALGDYSVNRYLGIRAGKVKIRWGLYNDTQDYDPGYMWSLLPEGIYGVDVRATNLSQVGAEAYGSIPLPKGAGHVDYSAYYGEYWDATNDGYMAALNASGWYFDQPPGGKTPGFDFRWSTPVKGLKVGGSLMMFNAKGNLTAGGGTFAQPLTFWPTYYGSYDNRKFAASYEYVRLVQYQTVTLTGAAPVTTLQDSRSWFLMGSYKFNQRLQAGAYYTSFIYAGQDMTDPANYFHDWVLSGRYNIDSNFYVKLEGHKIDGNATGFYSMDNPNGLAPNTKLVVAKVGFTF